MFELLEVRPVNYVPTHSRPYIHINFVPRSSEQGSQEMLFFAELYLCGKRKSPSGYSVTCCEPLGDDSTGKFFSYYDRMFGVFLACSN
jgi:hypothetical protein